jgi:transposase
MSQEKLINGLLCLQGWEVIEDGVVLTADEVVVPIARLEGTVFRCGGCGEGQLFAYDYRPMRKVRDFSIWGRRCVLEFTPARVSCPACGVCSERLDWLEPYERQTLRYERYLAQLCHLMPCLDVAELEGVDKNTVYRLDRKWLERRAELRPQHRVEKLGIDEIAIRKGHKYATLFYDLERREVIGGVLGREGKAVNRFFRRWSKEARAGVKAVCTDLWSAYHNSVKRYLKNATIVFDKFHVYGYLGQAVDQVRRDEQNQALKQSGQELIKGSRWLWLRNSKTLRRKQRHTLEEIMAINKNLQRAYLLKEDFEEFYTCETRDEAEQFLKQWTGRCKRTVLHPFHQLAKRLERWKEGILAYFEQRITNAVSEGINNKIKVLKRRSYGLNDFKYFLLKILDATDALPPMRALTHSFQE